MATTAAKSHVHDNGHAPPAEHPVVSEARKRRPEDVQAYADEYLAVTTAVERGDVPVNVVNRSDAKTGAEFRESFQKKVSANVG